MFAPVFATAYKAITGRRLGHIPHVSIIRFIEVTWAISKSNSVSLPITHHHLTAIARRIQIECIEKISYMIRVSLIIFNNRNNLIFRSIVCGLIVCRIWQEAHHDGSSIQCPEWVQRLTLIESAPSAEQSLGIAVHVVNDCSTWYFYYGCRLM